MKTLMVYFALVLCSVLVCVPSVVSIQCYSCIDNPAIGQSCQDTATIKQCPAFFDRCTALAITATFQSSTFTVTQRDCGISYNCSTPAICNLVTASLNGSGITVTACNFSCCSGDLCNVPPGGVGNATAMPPWTNPPNTQLPPAGCGRIRNNTLVSPNYPGPYPHNMDCLYTLRIPHGKAMRITFHDLDVEYESTCQYDYVRIANERNQTFGTFCGNNSGQVVDVTGQYVIVTFHSDFMAHRRGFLITFSATANGNSTPPPWTPNPTYPPGTTNPPWTNPPTGTQQPPNGCGGIRFNTLKSPNYPGPYSHNMNCRYIHHIPHGKAMRIFFRDFYLENGYDYMRIWNERNQTFGSFTGIKTGQVVVVTGRFVIITFQSDSSVQKRGYFITFNATANGNSTAQPPLTSNPTNPPGTTSPPWTNPPTGTQSPNGCGGIRFNTLKSPNYPGPYPNNMNCRYTHHIPHGKAMRIFFRDFYLENGFDFMRIWNERNQAFGSFTGIKTGQVVVVTGRYVIITFQSDSSVQKRGYFITFNATANGNSTAQPPLTSNPTNPPGTTSPPWTNPPPGTQSPNGCGGIRFNSLKSPNYPGPYPNNMDCRYTLRIPHGNAMRILFRDFDLENNYDYMRIWNERNQTFGSFTGIKTGQVVVVTGRYVIITFQSDSSVQRRGYFITFNAISNGNSTAQPPLTSNPTNPPGTTSPPWTNPPTGTQSPNGCGGIRFNSLKSPNYPGPYPNNMDCRYTLRIPHGNAMRILFRDFDLENRYDFMRIWNERNQTFGTFTGNRDGHVVVVTGRYVIITFHSDSSVSRRGYFITFHATLNGSVTQPPTPQQTYPPWTTNPPWNTNPPWTTNFPTGGPQPSMPSVQSRLRQGLQALHMITNEMERIVDNELGNGNFVISDSAVVKFKTLATKALSDVHEAMRSEGRQKRDVVNTRLVQHLEKRAAELLNKMATKQGRDQTLTDVLEKKKREAKVYQIVQDTFVSNIKDTVAKLTGKEKKDA